MGDLTVGVDLGGTNLRVGVVSAQGLTAVVRHALVDRTVDGVVDAMVRAVKESLALAKVSRPVPVGVGVAGQVEGGTVAVAPNLGWRNAPLGAMLTERLNTQVILSNDLSAAAWGEFKHGAGRGEDEVYTVFVGTGVGSAIISSGRLLQGASGVAGELGHIKVVRDGRQCGCGQHGCLEAYAGGACLAGWMQDEGLTGSAADLERLVAGGSAKAQQLFDFVAESLGVAIANQVTVLNPGILVLGGGVLTNSPRLTQAVVALVKTRTSARAAARVQIKMSALGDDSGLIGAALLADVSF